MGARPEKSWRTAPHLRQDRQTQTTLQGARQGTPAPLCTPWAGSSWGAPSNGRTIWMRQRERDPVKSTPLAFVRQEAEAPWVFGGEGAQRTTAVRGVGFEGKAGTDETERKTKSDRRRRESLGGRLDPSSRRPSSAKINRPAR